jgi:hypothetical protein
LEDRGPRRTRLQLADKPGDPGVVDIGNFGKRRGEERPPAALLDEVGELTAQPTLEYGDRLALQ